MHRDETRDKTIVEKATLSRQAGRDGQAGRSGRAGRAGQRVRPAGRRLLASAFPATLFAALFVLLALPSAAHAYVGPGAGFAFLTSFLVLFATFLAAFAFFLTWPIRFLIKRLRRHGRAVKGAVDRVIIVGFDGLDPELLSGFMDAGKMPNMTRLISGGSFRRMRSTCPPISPVAWSSFSTGVNPGKHNIFDFLAPERKSYLSKLSSADIRPPTRWLSLGKFRLPLNKPSYRPMRKSKPFWTILGEHEVFASVIRVPITFPPEKFYGVLLSSLCVPDLRGTQGSFSYYTTDASSLKAHTGGFAYGLRDDGGALVGDLIGPDNIMVKGAPALSRSFKLSRDGNGGATLEIGKAKHRLALGKHSPWIKIEFSAGLGVKVSGLARFILKSVEPQVELYVTPINIDPEKPAMPVSHPYSYAVYLAKLHGPFATLGLAEDTWALNERIIDESQFLEQCYLINEEREKMLFTELERVRKGAVICVFDITDRIQHMLWRYTDDKHPANRGKETTLHRDAFEKLYLKVDETVGRLLPYLNSRTALVIMSDHGFKAFRRGVNLNSWLLKEGYMHLKSGAESGEWFENVDWSRTKAYALGLGGIYVNLKGRESQGIVERADLANLVTEIKDLLDGLEDGAGGEIAIKQVYDARDVYSGPYVSEGPDLIVGYNAGYRASWDAVQGKVSEEIFSDNTKAWSGDHCIDPDCVPAVLVSNLKIATDSPSIQDIAPSVLNLLGVKVPPFMDGKVVIEAPAEKPTGKIKVGTDKT
jgi:predicted AlkP superfamily phosphohydrolase/phosphomutase